MGPGEPEGTRCGFPAALGASAPPCPASHPPTPTLHGQLLRGPGLPGWGGGLVPAKAWLNRADLQPEPGNSPQALRYQGWDVWTARILEFLVHFRHLPAVPLGNHSPRFIKWVNRRHPSLLGEMATRAFAMLWSEPGGNEAMWALSTCPARMSLPQPAVRTGRMTKG